MPNSTKTLLVLIAACAISAPAQNAKTGSSLSSLVNSELAFARASAEHGMDSAFIAFLADDAVIFRPHPVNGQEWFHSHPASPVLLDWSPGFADVSLTGELGYTTGPFMARDKGDTAAPPAYGEFVTIWKKRGSAWKVALDLGISHPGSSMGGHFRVPAAGPGPSVLVRPDSGFKAAELSKLRAREQTAFGDSLHPVSVSGLAAFLSPTARLLRPGRLPFVGSDSAGKFLRSQAGKTFRRSLGGDLSRGGDLAYSYGLYRFQGEDEKDRTLGYYLTVWKKQGKGKWNIVLDLQAAPLKKQ